MQRARRKHRRITERRQQEGHKSCSGDGNKVVRGVDYDACKHGTEEDIPIMQ